MSSGRVPDRWSFNDGINPASASGVYCGSFQSFYAMGLFQIWAAAGVSVAGEGWRWCSSTSMEARDFLVNFVSFRGFYAKSLRQLSLIPVSSYLYLYVFLIQ
jgi:hypothetical protein